VFTEALMDLYFHESALHQLEILEAKLHLSHCPKVCYPCSGLDITPSMVFVNSEVTYVDYREEAVRSLVDGGFDAHKSMAEDFHLEGVELLLLINPQASPDEIASNCLETGGYVVCNNWHLTASWFKNHPDQYAYLMAIDWLDGCTRIVTDQDSLGRCWSTLADEKELEETYPEFYKDLQGTVESYNQFLEMIGQERRMTVLGYCLSSFGSLPPKYHDVLYVFQKI
jgi:hypothetical protein